MSSILHDISEMLFNDDDQIPDLETPYSSFTNDRPDSKLRVEGQSTRAIITERQQQLDDVLHEMSGLKKIVDTFNNLHEQLVEKQDKITQSMNSHKRLVSSLRGLPTEILSQIFVYCLPEDSHLSLAQNQAPVLLTRICREWRKVAVDMPNLWCRLHLNLKNRRNLQQQENLYSLCLKRSRGRPLSLVIDCYANQMVKLRNFLQPHGYHISYLSIPCVRGTPEVFGGFSALQELVLNNTTTRTSSSIVTCIMVLPSTVRSLKVTGLFSLNGDLSRIPTLALLTHIEASLCSLSVVIRLIRLCSNLSSLVIHKHASDRIPATDSALVLTHTALQSLRILEAGMSATSLLPGLFNILSLPNLRILEISGSRTWPHEEVKALLTRSNCPLESLIIGAGMVTTDEQRAEYVALIPSLVVTHFIK
ncbi:hypothetical protein DFJ58DRAFT_868692 [Suillus subalutaceus]|uniref:uncharacterized protein n=1 Tax=Suillus subalutaceus TaxID=48586 RepID=UPI001B87B909|nr:uncharacterized protein DFJ58DRAFT_868692 [Suillus subalutaceus]KAG1863562.1 hypothetical protein DFJ58DRAFT_868692 [Suillus subalutaceus]